MSSDRILFSPISIGKVSIKNRFAMAPMGPLGLGDAQGGFNQRGIDYYTARARGGTGLIITGVTFVDNTMDVSRCLVVIHRRARLRFQRSARSLISLRLQQRQQTAS